jgi:hypothetical protein
VVLENDGPKVGIKDGLNVDGCGVVTNDGNGVEAGSEGERVRADITVQAGLQVLAQTLFM